MKCFNRGIVLATIICVVLGSVGCSKGSSDLVQGVIESVETVSISERSAGVSLEVNEEVFVTSISEKEMEHEEEQENKPVPFEERLLVAPSREDVEPEIAAVLYDNAPFTVFEFHEDRSIKYDDPNEFIVFVSKEFSLKEYDYLTHVSDDLDGEYEPIELYFKGFSIVDMDRDGANELVYWVESDDVYSGDFLVFSVVEGEVCAYIIDYHSMGILSFDGTMDTIDGQDSDIWTIVKFTKEGFKKKVIATMRTEECRIGDCEVTLDEFSDYFTKEILSKSALWTATEDLDSWLNHYSK